MPLYLFYTMVQKSQKMTKNSNQGGSCLKAGPLWFEFLVIFDFLHHYRQNREASSAEIS